MPCMVSKMMRTWWSGVSAANLRYLGMKRFCAVVLEEWTYS